MMMVMATDVRSGNVAQGAGIPLESNPLAS